MGCSKKSFRTDENQFTAAVAADAVNLARRRIRTAQEGADRPKVWLLQSKSAEQHTPRVIFVRSSRA